MPQDTKKKPRAKKAKAPIPAKPELSPETKRELRKQLDQALFAAIETKAEADAIAERADIYRKRAIALAEELGETEVELKVDGIKLATLKQQSTRSTQVDNSVDVTSVLTPHQILKGFKPTVKLLESLVEGATSAEAAEKIKSAIKTTKSISWRLNGPKADSAFSKTAAQERKKQLDERLFQRMKEYAMTPLEEEPDYAE